MAAFTRDTIVIRPEPKIQARALHLPVPAMASSQRLLHALVLAIGFAALIAKVAA